MIVHLQLAQSSIKKPCSMTCTLSLKKQVTPESFEQIIYREEGKVSAQKLLCLPGSQSTHGRSDTYGTFNVWLTR